MNSSEIKKIIQENGHRITKTRTAILGLFNEITEPITAVYILEKLHNDHIRVNKTTVYRELQFLVKQNIIKPIQLQQNIVSYELLDQDHHHHIVCNNCGKIEDVVLSTEKFLNDVIKQTNFKLQSHSLEFFGQCGECV